MPRPQLRRAQEEVPGGQKWPSGHTAQEVDPAREEKLPPGQGAQVGEPGAAPKEPGAQARHAAAEVDARAGLYAPRGH